MVSKTKLKEVTPIEFCRTIKSAQTGLTLHQVMCQEERGTFKEYCLILSRELDIPYTTIKTKWGNGIEFPGMPDRLKNLLKFVLTARLSEIGRMAG